MLMEVAYVVLQFQTDRQTINRNQRGAGISGYTKANILSVKVSDKCAEMLKIKLRW